MSKPSLATLRRYALFGVVLLLHIAVFFALSKLIIFKAPVEAQVFDRVQIPKPVAPPPPPPPEPPPNLIAPSDNISPSAPAVTPQAITAVNPALTIPTVDPTQLPMPNTAVVSPTPTPSPDNGLTGTEGQGSATGDIGVLSNGLKNGTPADTRGYVAFSQATLDTASAVDKIESAYPNVAWNLAFSGAVDQSTVKVDPVTHRLKIQDNLQCLCVGDPTTVTITGVTNGMKRDPPKNVVLILDLTDPSDRNEQFAKDLVRVLRDKSIRLFIIPMTLNGAETAIHGPVYQCLSSYVTESGGVVYFPAGVPKDNDNTNP